MMFNDIDEWMLSIELKKMPTFKERRQHIKLERIRDESYEKYLARFNKNKGPYDVPKMKCCLDRLRTPLERTMNKMWESYKKELGMVQTTKPNDYN